MNWRLPVPPDDILFTDALITEWMAAAESAGEKAKAFPDSRLRFSDAGICSGQLAYKGLGVKPDHPTLDPAGLWVTGLGTMIHELLQAALRRRYPHLLVEVKAIIRFTSGHCDAVVEIDGIRWLYELKTVGGFAFQKAIGLERYEIKNPQGPRRSAILQAGLNALANDCHNIAIGYIALEAVSVQRAAKTGLGQLDRILAEWHLDHEDWMPMALAELARQQAVLADIDSGWLPKKSAPDDEGKLVDLDPLASRVPWQCEYCSFRQRCEGDGAARTPIPVEVSA